MEITVEFWGGPKDGEAYQMTYVPTEHFIVMEGFDTAIDVLNFFNSVKDHPLRTQKYHDYILEQKSEESYRYVYQGLI